MRTVLTPNDTILLNRGMGWVKHVSVEKGYRDPNDFDCDDRIQAVALLSSWAKIEKDDGVFDFSDLDDAVRKYAEDGKEIHLRISTDPMIYRNEACGVPDWLFDRYSVTYQTKMIYGIPARFPDYLNKTYLKKVHRFVDALCTRYASLKNVVQMDLRGYGEWGEWHSGYMHEDIETHMRALQGIIRTWDEACAGRLPLVLSASYEWRRDQSLKLFAPPSYEAFKRHSAFDDALRRPGITFRRDGVGGALKVNDYLLLQEYFEDHHHHPITTEFFIGYDQQKTSEDGVRGYFAEDAVEEALQLHPNYSMLMWDSRSFFHERPDLIDHGLRRMGYRLYPSLIETEIRNGTLEVRHTWTNLAVGRIHIPHEIVIKVKGTSGTTEHVLPHLSLHEATENHPVFHVSVLTLDNPDDVDELSIGIRFKDDGSMVKLPVDGASQDGWVKIALSGEEGR